MERETGMSPQAVEIFYAYADGDEALRNELEKHLSVLHRQGLILSWHDRRIVAGTDWEKAIDRHLETASLILLLISSDFLATDYCMGCEMKRAMARHRAKEAQVIPILLRPMDCRGASFGHLQSWPTDGRAVTEWENVNAAFSNIVVIFSRLGQKM